jgi:hypothetical protein
MQVLSQLSYNPTRTFRAGPLVGALSVAIRPPAFAIGCSSGEFCAPRSPACTDPGSLMSEAHAYCSRVNASISRIAQAFWPPQSTSDADLTLT